jgi:hypothetical protein
MLAALAGGATSAAATASPGWRIVATVGTATSGELPGWFTATGATGVQYLYHYGPRGWARQAIPTKPGATTTLQTLTWIPGTSSLWAAGTLFAGSAEIGDILKYGP